MFGRPSAIEKQLLDAKSRLATATTALAPKHKGGEWEAFLAARQDVLRLEREVAKSKNEIYAIPCDFR